MRKKLLCTISAVAMLSGLFVVGAAPAQAVPPTDANNFNPQDSTIGADGINNLVLTDKNDGIDTLAHITSVATTNATQAIYVVCPQGTTPVDEPVPPSGCETIGTDSAGEPVTGAGQTGLDEAYEFFWNIPSTFDQITRDILAYHCNGAPTSEEPGGNCLLEIEPAVDIDDGQSGSTTTTAAEYRDYCVDFNGDNDCADGEEERLPFEHPTTIPNLELGQTLVVRARSSDDGITFLTSCLDGAADATAGSLDSCTFSDSSGGQAAQAFKDYTFVYGDASVPDDSELGFFLHNVSDDGSGFCSGADCLFDSHYVVSTTREASEARVFFDPAGNGGPPDPENVNANSSCETPDKEDTNRVGDNTPIRGCILDQFGVHMDTTVTFESSGVGFFVSCGGGTPHDHDGDGVAEHCHHDSGGPDAEASATLRSTVPGDQTITFCFDPENGGATANPPPADHGCADETVVDTLVKHWISGLPEHVHLVYAGTGSDANPCHTGAKFRQNLVGDQEDLLACTFDGFDNPSTTDQTNGGFLEWSIGAGGDDEVDTQFVGTPPSETGSDARATATIEAIEPGQDNPSVTLRNEAGTAIDGDSVTKNVTGFPPPDEKADSNVSIRHRAGPHRFIGRVSSDDDSCEPGRRVIVRRVRRGRDPRIGADTTNARGRYRVGHRRTRSRFRYYARVRGNADCLGDTSGRTPRVR